ncbi:hypothetical protein BgiBS90_033898, partial [Biomphalaria glabrata]
YQQPPSLQMFIPETDNLSVDLCVCSDSMSLLCLTFAWSWGTLWGLLETDCSCGETTNDPVAADLDMNSSPERFSHRYDL